MHTEQKIEGNSPFKEHSRTSMFFSGSSRGEILHGVQRAVEAGVHLITLVGEEGCGKTMLCKMLQEESGKSNKIVLLPKVVGSFEDIVRVIALECKIDVPSEKDRGAAQRIFLELLATLREQGESLVLVCDEAEKMYQATLERIRKVLDEANAAGGGVQLLLSGRSELQKHLGQLELCEHNEISEEHFEVPPLNEEETWEYLNFCMQVRGQEKREVFTREAAGKIASMARGNLQMINILADESLKSSNADMSFLVLLDHVSDSCAIEPKSSSPFAAVFDRLPFPPKYFYVGGFTFLLLVVLLMFKGSDDGESVVPVETDMETVEVVTPPIIPSGEGAVSPAAMLVQRGNNEKAVAEETSVEAIEEITAEEPPAETTEEGVAAEELPAEAIEKGGAVDEPPIETIEEVAAEESPAETIEGIVSIAADEQTVSVPAEETLGKPLVRQHTPVDISPVEIVEGAGTESAVLELSERNKIIHGTGIQEITATSKKKIIGGQPERQEAPKPVAVTRELPANATDPVLGSLVMAGEEWRSGSFDDKFSIQLMVLTSDQAENNLKRILAENEYQAVLDKLVVLQRPVDPPVILVFYGTYPSMAAARSARNNMPIFLRKHHPYAISVRGAVEKAGVE